MSSSQKTISSEKLQALNNTIASLNGQLNELMSQKQQSHTRISSISHSSPLHCECETKQIHLGKVGLSGKLRSFNYNLIAKDQYWGNRHGSSFDIYIQRNNSRIVGTGDIWASRYGEQPTTYTDRVNDHFNDHHPVNIDEIQVYSDDDVYISLRGHFGGHTVDIQNLHVNFAIDC